jgi:hypothetical protein
MSSARSMCLICTPSHPFISLFNISQTYSSPFISDHFDAHIWQMHSMIQSRRVEAEDNVDQLVGPSQGSQDGNELLSDLDPIPLQILQYPAISDFKSLPAAPDGLHFTPKHPTWLDSIREVEKRKIWPNSPERPVLRRAKMRVRRLSVSSNPEVHDLSDHLHPPSRQRSFTSTAPDEDEEDSFGLNSRRRSSAENRLRRRKTTVSFMPYSLKVSGLDRELEGDPATWSTCATRSNSNAWPESIVHDAEGECDQQPGGDLRGVAMEGSLLQRRRASLPPFVMWKERVHFTFLRCSV